MKNLLLAALRHLLRPIYGGVGCILALHRVLPGEQRSGFSQNRALEITPDDLDAVIRDVLERGMQIVALDDVPKLLGARRWKRKFVCFTFDDGYIDVLTHACPVFQRYGAPFAVNIVTSFADQRGLLWWYLLEHLLNNRARLVFRAGGRSYDLHADSAVRKRKTFDVLAAIIRGMDQRNRDGFIIELFEGLPVDPVRVSSELVMEWAAVKKLASEPLVTIGAHGVNHFDFHALDDGTLRSEILDSKTLIESHLGRPVRHFAYPFGGRNAVGPREFAVAKSCGFTTMLTTRPGNLFRAHARHLECLPRLGLSGNYPAVSRWRRLESGLIPAVENRFRKVITD